METFRGSRLLEGKEGHMKFTRFGWYIVALVLFGALSSASAANAPTVLTPPAGSYLLTCNHEAMAGTTLVAMCDTGRFAGAIPARLSYPSETSLVKAYECVGDISNDHGTLKCGRGSFRQSCTGIVVSPATYYGSHSIIAQCKKNDGTQADAKLTANLWACNDIANSDGTLTCN
jgi:hypothetical protein